MNTSLSRAGFRLLLTSPVVWALHFLASYVTAAVWCARAGGGGGAGMAGAAVGAGAVQVAIAVYTLVALAAIALVGRRGLSHWRRLGDHASDGDAPAERARFIGSVTVLLSGLSAVAVAYAAVVAAFFGNCR
jgi:hypothetical protein